MTYNLDDIRHKLRRVQHHRYMPANSQIDDINDNGLMLPNLDNLDAITMQPTSSRDYLHARIDFNSIYMLEERLNIEDDPFLPDIQIHGALSHLILWWSFKIPCQIRILCDVCFEFEVHQAFDTIAHPCQRLEYHLDGHLTPWPDNDGCLLPDDVPYSRGYAYPYCPEWYIMPDAAALAHEALVDHYASLLGEREN